ncbi:MAG: hypothetical protein BMS9Abin15_0476 [Gammaproteobacteria bacterium]|nr:MAG: hypothetical protein BMS9Abin15_0476 [Gammaproteobacteria bacterium]
MMGLTGRATLFLIAGLIVGCSGNGEPEAKQPAKDHILKEQVDALEKARGVEQILQQGVEQRKSVE